MLEGIARQQAVLLSMSRREEILDLAERLLEAEGADALTMRRIAAELGIQAPSLYKHVANKEAIEAGLQERGLRRLAVALAESGNCLEDVAAGYRSWALANPQLYDLATRRPLRRDGIPPEVEEAAAAPLVAAVGGDATLARALWGLAHGLVDLEIAGRFPADADLDAAWRAGLAPFLRHKPRRQRRPRPGAQVGPTPANAGRT